MPLAEDLGRRFAALSLRLVSTTHSAVSFVIVTFFAVVLHRALSRLRRWFQACLVIRARHDRVVNGVTR